MNISTHSNHLYEFKTKSHLIFPICLFAALSLQLGLFGLLQNKFSFKEARIQLSESQPFVISIENNPSKALQSKNPTLTKPRIKNKTPSIMPKNNNLNLNKLKTESLKKTSTNKAKNKTQLIQTAKLINHYQPRYPRIAEEMGLEGVVKLSLIILADGTVGHSKLLKSSGYKIFDKEAIKEIKNYKFVPAKDTNGNNIRSSLIQNVVYKLNNT